jgi:hypothetical protein
MWDQNNWTNTSLTDYLYNSNGTINQETTQIWNKSTNQWQNYSQDTYTYNGSKKVLTKTTSNWEDNQWVTAYLDTYSYTANDVLTNILEQNWNKTLLNWKNREQTNYIYNQDGTIHQEIRERWNESKNLWNNWLRATFEYDKNLGIADLTKSQLKIFPNPTTDFINVHLEESNDTKVSIIDALGSVILKENFVGNDFSVNVMNLNKNVYFIKLENGEKTQVKKFIKK